MRSASGSQWDISIEVRCTCVISRPRFSFNDRYNAGLGFLEETKMKTAIDGAWVDRSAEVQSTDGSFIRKETAFRN